MWEGKCLRCGKCCILDTHWLNFNDEKEKQDKIEWAEARGCRLVQIGNNVIQAEFNHKCPKFRSGTEVINGIPKVVGVCALQDEKPEDCSGWPFTIKSSDIPDGIDPNKIMPKGCGFKWIGVN